MLPDDWAEERGPEILSFPKDLQDYFRRYVFDLEGGRPAQWVTRTAVRAGATSVMVERNYIDADYRNEFANFYAQTFRHLPDRCQRLHFADLKTREYQGFAVMRPILGRPVCRTMLAPPPGLAPYVSCLTQSRAFPYGFRFGIRGFPFISQDYQYGVCAHAAIWMVAHYFHLEFRRPRFYVSDIVEGAKQSPYIYRQVPSVGLTHEQISAALEALRMPAISYVLDELPQSENSHTIACRYLNSRLPVILLGGQHARVLIGYGADDHGELFFICNDDARGPYLAIQDAETAYAEAEVEDAEAVTWERLVVPVPGRIYLAGEPAEREGALALRRELAKAADLSEILKSVEDGDTRVRTYVSEIADYKRRLRGRGVPPEVVAHHARISCSHWVWIVELQDRSLAAKGRRCVLGEVVIDATSDGLKPNFLFANLPGRVMRWEALGGPTLSADVPKGEPYETGCALHAPSPHRNGGLKRLIPGRR
jgi:hypothetical protein